MKIFKCKEEINILKKEIESLKNNINYVKDSLNGKLYKIKYPNGKIYFNTTYLSYNATDRSVGYMYGTNDGIETIEFFYIRDNSEYTEAKLDALYKIIKDKDNVYITLKHNDDINCFIVNTSKKISIKYDGNQMFENLEWNKIGDVNEE